MGIYTYMYTPISSELWGCEAALVGFMFISSPKLDVSNLNWRRFFFWFVETASMLKLWICPLWGTHFWPRSDIMYSSLWVVQCSFGYVFCTYLCSSFMQAILWSIIQEWVSFAATCKNIHYRPDACVYCVCVRTCTHNTGCNFPLVIVG